ncbi:uncharacterized protein LOC115879195 [Sitophilus oryzae]|uniref:Uncharacterized protein LOC115879195 n=1 Tax=Sitophilus oryzae TaxID=7048 RepID=A0A6J2XKY3_SITOR|nr:uncharacterized protein LOC115879195 [Sitophilus oryzae]
MIFGHRKKLNERLLDGGPVGSKAWCSDSGWITSELFIKWLNFFIQCVRPSKDLPILLILDNHISHQSLDGLNLARDCGVIILSVPPHTTHRLQPLDVAVYKPFKAAFEGAVDMFQKNHPGRRITQFDIAQLVKIAFEKSATVQTATNGFRKCGIFPFNRNIFSETDFAPAEVHFVAPENKTDQDEIRSQATAVTLRTDEDDTDSDEDISLAALKNSVKITKDTRSVVPSCEIAQPGSSRINKPGVNDKNNNASPVFDSAIEIDKSMVVIQDVLNSTPPASPEKQITCLVSPKDIFPLPKAAHSVNEARKRKCQKSEILTSSPYKLMLENKGKEKLKKPKQCNLQSSLDKDGKNSEGSGQKKKGIPRSKPKQENNIFCITCGEEYENPPTETWIQCSLCEEWAHELCSDLSGMKKLFFCDNCR